MILRVLSSPTSDTAVPSFTTSFAAGASGGRDSSRFLFFSVVINASVCLGFSPVVTTGVGETNSLGDSFGETSSSGVLSTSLSSVLESVWESLMESVSESGTD